MGSNKVVNDVEYSVLSKGSKIWWALDGSNRGIAGPELVDGKLCFWVGELADYFPLQTQKDGYADEHIDIKGPGFLELFMSCVEDPIKRLEKMEFQMKKLVELRTGEEKTFEELRIQYNKNPRYPQRFGRWRGCSIDDEVDFYLPDVDKAAQERELAEMQYEMSCRDFPLDDDEDIDARLALKCPHYSSYNGEYGGSGSLYRG